MISGAIKDRQFESFAQDDIGNTARRVIGAWSPQTALDYIRSELYLTGFRYFTQTEDSSFVYVKYFNADDVFVSGFKVSKTEVKAELYYPFLFQEDNTSKILTEGNEAILL